MRGFVASTYTYLWKSDVVAAIDGIAEAGLRRVEILAAPPHVDAADWRAAADLISAACARTGVRVSSVVPSGVDVNLASPDSTMRDWSVGYFTTIGRLAAMVGADALIVHPGRRHPLRPAPPERYRQWVLDGIGRVLDALTGVGIGVLFENTPTGVLDTGAECAQLAEDVDHDGFAVCYDVANGHMVENVDDGVRAAASHLGLVHVSDTTRASWRHDPIGTGEVDFRLVGNVVGALDYRGDVVLETLHDGDPVAGFAADLAALGEAGWSSRR